MTTVNITKLLPNQPYNVWIRAYTTDSLYNESLPLKVVTLPDPEKIELVSSTSKSLTIEWEPYARAMQYIMKFRPIGYDDSAAEIILDSTHKQQINTTNVQHNGKKLTVLNLHPKTQYQFWLSFQFANRSDPYNWPLDEHFVFETYADRPNAPGKPRILNIHQDVYQVIWLAAEGNGAMIEEYSLEGLRYHVLNRPSRSTNSNSNSNGTHNETAATDDTLLNIPLTVDESMPIADEWTEYYRGNDTYWIIKDLSSDLAQYTFRVRARNAYGWSEFSTVSDRITEIFPFVAHREYLFIAAAVPALVTIVIVTFCCIVCGEF